MSGLKSGVPCNWLGVVEAKIVELMLAGRYRLMSWTMTPGIAKSTTVKTSMTLVKIESEAADDRTIEAMPRPMRPTIARSIPLSISTRSMPGCEMDIWLACPRE